MFGLSRSGSNYGIEQRVREGIKPSSMYYVSGRIRMEDLGNKYHKLEIWIITIGGRPHLTSSPLGQHFLIFLVYGPSAVIFTVLKKKIVFWPQGTCFPEHLPSCWNKIGPVIRRLWHKLQTGQTRFF